MTAIIQNWIYEENLHPFMTALGWISGYHFDEDGWTAVNFGARSADEGAGVWFHYALEGDSMIEAGITQERGESVFTVRIEADEKLAARVGLSIDFCQNFRFA
ncbi:MAG: hypothetical protein JWM59_4207 [Verrucomicrobiales bacterium]|nr:hypothetical protein [Verrucomicrobiales bacterium]